MARKEGDLVVEDFFDLTSGLNTADSPFRVPNTSAAGGQNFEYTQQGAIRMRTGVPRLNTSANSQLRTLGLGLWDKPANNRQVIRYAGEKIQNFNTTSYAFTNLYGDAAFGNSVTATISVASPGVITKTAHGLDQTDPVKFATTGALPTGLTAGTVYYVKTVLSANTFTVSATPGGTVINTSGTQSGTQSYTTPQIVFESSGSTVPVVTRMFNTADAGILWSAGGGQSTLYGVYSTTQATANGSEVPTGSISTSSGGTGGTLPAGTYYYAVALRKASTKAISNAVLDKPASPTAGQNVTVTLSTVTADTTKYDAIVLYRSSISGAEGFTAGSIVSVIDITGGIPTNYVDTGTSFATSQTVPRANSLVLDNSKLPSGTYNSLTVFKQRLITASNSTVYLSEVNKSESWPTANTINIPSGGAITGLATISLTTSQGFQIDELLCVFKQSELWVITGSSLDDWELKFVDKTGCPSQPLIITANQYIAWVNYRGVFMWDGSGKPAYVSEFIEDKFQQGGDINKTNLNIGYGLFLESKNQLMWMLSSNTLGTQQFALKLDLRLTTDSRKAGLTQPQLSGVFTPDYIPFATYAGLSCILSDTSTDDITYVGGASGDMYQAYTGPLDGSGTAIGLEYITPYLTFDEPNTAKRINKVVAWVQDNGPSNVTLDFWSQYRFEDTDASSIVQPISTSPNSATLTWDSADQDQYWDVGIWDGPNARIKPLVFNLFSVKNNTEGDAFRFKFSISDNSKSIVIYGFSIYYTLLTLRK